MAQLILRLEHTEDSAHHVLRAYPSGRGVLVGQMIWHKGTYPPPDADYVAFGLSLYEAGEVVRLHVAEPYRRCGVATVLWQQAHRYDPPPVHSWRTTADGRAWALAVGGDHADRTAHTAAVEARIRRAYGLA